MKTNPLPPKSLALQSQPYSDHRQLQLRRLEPQNQLARQHTPVGKSAADFVYSGEFQESGSYQKYYLPHFDQQIVPQNRSAIINYESTTRGGRVSRSVGLILNNYI